jgi:hypothetical protein
MLGMVAYKLNWKEASIEAGRLTVPVVPTPDDSWAYDFAQALSTLRHETRGQQFTQARVDDGELQVDGINTNDEALKLTADFFDVVVAQAAGQREREERRREADKERLAREHEDRTGEEQAAAEKLRERE